MHNIKKEKEIYLMSQFQKLKPTKYVERAKKDISSGKKERNQRTSGNAWIVEKQIYSRNQYIISLRNQSCRAKSEKSKILMLQVIAAKIPTLQFNLNSE